MVNKSNSLFEAWGIPPAIRRGGLMTLFGILIGLLGHFVNLYTDSEQRNVQLTKECQERERMQNEKQLKILEDALERQQIIEDKLRAATQNLKRKK